MNESVSQIYVVDDDISVREAVARLIKSAGLSVKTFATAQEILAALEKELPSCLVLDMVLPDINGLELQQKLATKDIQIPIIFLTGHGDIPMSVRAVRAGALNFLTKPFRTEELLSALDQAIKRGHQVEQLRSRPTQKQLSAEKEPRSEIRVSEIAGQRAALRQTMRQTETMAFAEANVLVKPKSLAEEICATCRRPLIQRGPNGECLRCLFNWGFLSEGRQSGQETTASRCHTSAPLRYAHFEVEVDEDGFPVELGAGAMAIVYRARDTVLNSVVALKVIDRKIAENAVARSRFLREARAAAQIRHPNVARVTHYGEEHGECFYAMELVEGETLEARVRREGPMPVVLALRVIERATHALAAAERCGVVHRDIKPSNLMIESDASDSLVIKVIDYGVSKMVASGADLGADQTRAGFIGTPAFASPEQFADASLRRIDMRSDIYSLGVTLWYLLCGRAPFAGHTLEEIRARQANELPVEQLRIAHVPAQVVALLKSMLAIDPANRPQSARELLALVQRCYQRFEPRARAGRMRFALTTAILALGIATTGFGIWWHQPNGSSARTERSTAVLPFENLGPHK
jgi:FixJ family two-component response regulator/tRNA A-37 threonylcarbamoyl transferase component Bud32